MTLPASSLDRIDSSRLTLEDELRLTREVEISEANMARAIVRAPSALEALAKLGEDVRAGRRRTRDVIRIAEHATGAAGENRRRLLSALDRAGRLAGRVGALDLERRELADELCALRVQPSVLEGMARAIPDGQAEARQAFATARRSAERAKAEWTASSAYLVLAIARRYRRPGVETIDLVQDGNIGLLRAIEKFDGTLGHRFPTYAAWWIRQHIFRALAEQSRTIRVPLPVLESVQRIKRARRVFAGTHGREPDDAELAALCGVDLRTIAAAEAVALEPVSLQTHLGDSPDDADLLDRLADVNVLAPDEEVARARLHDRLHALLDALAPREREILRLRFGLDGEAPRPLAEVAASLRFSRDRVRRIEERALARLRAWSTRDGLRAA